MNLYPETVYIYVKSPIKGIAKFWLWRFLTEIGNINDQGCWWSFHPVGPIQQPLAITSIKQLSWIWFGIDCELFRLLDFSCCSQYLLVEFTCLVSPGSHRVWSQLLWAHSSHEGPASRDAWWESNWSCPMVYQGKHVGYHFKASCAIVTQIFKKRTLGQELLASLDRTA